MASKKIERFTSPAGSLRYVYLNKARPFKGEKPAYQTQLLVEPGLAADEFERFLEQKFQESEQQFGTTTRANDVATREPDGKLCVRFRVAEITKTKKGDLWDRRPVFFDRFARPIPAPEVPPVGPGTVAKIGFTVYAWPGQRKSAGLSLQPLAVQILELREPAPEVDDPAAYGFEPEADPDLPADF